MPHRHATAPCWVPVRVLWCELVASHAVRLCLACLGLRIPSAPLCPLVGAVVGVTTEEQVRRIHTRRIVASVADKHAVRNRAVGEFPRHTMRQFVPALRRSLLTEIQHSVACRRSSPDPFPAPIRPDDLAPKSLVKAPAHLVAEDEAHGLPLDMAVFSVGHLRDGRVSAATTLTQSHAHNVRLSGCVRNRTLRPVRPPRYFNLGRILN